LQVISYTSLHTVDDAMLKLHKSFCIERWPSPTRRRAYSLAVFVVQFCLPLTITAGLYQRIYASLRRRRSSRLHGASINHRCRQQIPSQTRRANAEAADRQGTSFSCCGNFRPSYRVTCRGLSMNESGTADAVADSVASKDLSTTAARIGAASGIGEHRPFGDASTITCSAAAAAAASRRRRRGGSRTSRLLFAIVANFIAFWLPWNIFSLVIELDRTAVPGPMFRIMDLGLKVFALAGSACVNPFFYCWFNDNFRVELAGVIASVPLGLLRPGHRTRHRPRSRSAVADGLSPAGRRSGLFAEARNTTPVAIGIADLKVLPAAMPVEGGARQTAADGCVATPGDACGEADDRWRETSPDDAAARHRRRRRFRLQHQRSSSYRTTTTTTTTTTGCPSVHPPNVAGFRQRGLSRSFSVTEIPQNGTVL
jgi:hypothetical protein